MTLEEAIELAGNGDYEAIMALGKYYFEGDEQNGRDFHESLKWYTLGAEFGYSNCMCLAANLGIILGHTNRKIMPDSTESQFEYYDNALKWATKAAELGEENASNLILTIKGEMGISYHYAAINSSNSELYRKAIDIFQEIVPVTNNSEFVLFYGLSLYSYLKSIDSNDYNSYSIARNMLETSVTNNYKELESKLVGIACSLIGNMLTGGWGCAVDYDKAVYYYTLAGEFGFDCSDMLKLFRKKLFGGYTLA